MGQEPEMANSDSMMEGLTSPLSSNSDYPLGYDHVFSSENSEPSSFEDYATIFTLDNM